jgi:pimeloyl-[acyl-carrier protein] methyl ester esterase
MQRAGAGAAVTGRWAPQPEPALALIHGWGLGARVFDELAARLGATRALLRPDLPGYGDRRVEPIESELTGLARQVLAAVERPAHWVGWSLGGLVALEAARQAPDRVLRVTLVASAPRMLAGKDWPGLDRGQLAAFQSALVGDPAATLRRFRALQAHGCGGGRATLRAFDAAAARAPQPAMGALAAGLELLRTADLRGVTAGLRCPVEAVLGGADALLPAGVAEPLAGAGMPVRTLTGAGHAPFIAQPAAFSKALLETACEDPS